MTDILGDEDAYMNNTIFASQQVEYRARTAKRRMKEAERRKRNEEDRKARMLQAEVDRAEEWPSYMKSANEGHRRLPKLGPKQRDNG